MSNKTKRKPDNKSKRTYFFPFLAVAAAAICAVVVILVNGIGNGSEEGDTSGENSKAVTVSFGESLVISKADITEDASFYPIEVDGTSMEVIAVRDREGNIRTAFNTCQICYDSGRGYYVQSGDYLVCQNCGNRFSMDQVEIESGGCNPWPIFDENKTVTEDEIWISYDFLAEALGIFQNWKGSY